MSTPSNASNFDSLIAYINDGEPVDAAVANRPIGSLDQRTRYLLDLIRSLAIGQAIIIPGAQVSSDTVLGTPVYYNSDTQQFEPALTVSGYDTLTGRHYAVDSAISWGVVLRKEVSTQADILVMGYAELDISAALATDETVAAGTYYLSTSEAGKLTATPPPIAIPLLKNTGDGHVLVIPNWLDLFNGHTHLHFSLRPIPAGTHADPGTGNRHTITAPDSSIEGWLPANNAIFDGKAPNGAVFGYNISANASLLASWPPLTPDTAVLYQDGLLVSSDVTNGLVTFDENGIWWMSDCYDTVPFPPDINVTAETAADPYPVSESEYDVCPFPYAMRLELWFSKQEFSTDLNAVTRLTSSDARLVFSAEQGPVVGKLNLSFMVSNVDPGGFTACKALQNNGTVLAFGPVNTGVYSLSNAVTLTGESSAEVTVNDVVQDVFYGKVGIDVETSDDREITSELVRLDGAEEAFYNNVLYLALPVGRLTSLRARITVPITLSLTSPVMTLNLRVLATAAGTTSAMTVTYRRIPATNSQAVLPASDSSVTINTSKTFTSNYAYADIQSTGFVVAAGDDVLVTIQRAASDGYGADIGLLRISGILNGS